MDQLPRTEINRRWWNFMANVMQYTDRREPLLVTLQKVFHME